MTEQFEQFEINHGYMMMLDGWVNCYDRMPDKEGLYLIEDHSGQRWKAEAVVEFGNMVWKVPKRCGYDICFWKEMEK